MWWSIFPFSSHCYDNQKVCFFVTESKQIAITQKKLSQRCIFYPLLRTKKMLMLKKIVSCESVSSTQLLRTQTLTMRSKCSKNYFFIFLTTCHMPEFIWLVECVLFFLNSHDSQFGHFALRTYLKELCQVL